MKLLYIWTAAITGLSAQSFEVASIKPAPVQPVGSVSIHRSTDKGRLSYSNVSLTDMLGDGYRVAHRQISGPEWLDSVRFDIVAKIPEGSGEKQVPEMLLTLLRERFGLKVHEETKELPVYALVVGKAGPKMTKLEGAGSGIDGHSGKARIHISAKTTIDDFADYLSARLDRAVANQTGLEGAYALELEFAPESAEAADAPSVFTAVQEQLGLRLVSTRAPVRLIVVDSVAKVPVDN